MIIGDEKFAAELKDKENNVLKFDDIGCLKAYEKKYELKGVYAWVHDYQSGEWIESNKAFFVHSSQLVSPMGYGIAAFSSLRDAERFAKESNGRITTSDEAEKKFQEVINQNKGGEQK